MQAPRPWDHEVILQPVPPSLLDPLPSSAPLFSSLPINLLPFELVTL